MSEKRISVDEFIMNYTSVCEIDGELNNANNLEILKLGACGKFVNIISGRKWEDLYSRFWKEITAPNGLGSNSVVIESFKGSFSEHTSGTTLSFEAMFGDNLRFYPEFGTVYVNPFTNQKTLEQWLDGKLRRHPIKDEDFRQRIQSWFWSENDQECKTLQSWVKEHGDFIPTSHTVKMDARGEKYVLPLSRNSKDIPLHVMYPDFIFEAREHMLVAEILREPDGSILPEVSDRVDKIVKHITAKLEMDGDSEYFDVIKTNTSIDIPIKIDGQVISKAYGAGRIVKARAQRDGISYEEACKKILIIAGSPHDLEACDPLIDMSKDASYKIAAVWIGKNAPNNDRIVASFASMQEAVVSGKIFYHDIPA